MKKLLCLLLALLLTAAFTACGEESGTTPDPAEPSAALAADW